jgi:hypothetical protein
VEVLMDAMNVGVMVAALLFAGAILIVMAAR